MTLTFNPIIHNESVLWQWLNDVEGQGEPDDWEPDPQDIEEMRLRPGVRGWAPIRRGRAVTPRIVELWKSSTPISST